MANYRKRYLTKGEEVHLNLEKQLDVQIKYFVHFLRIIATANESVHYFAHIEIFAVGQENAFLTRKKQ